MKIAILQLYSMHGRHPVKNTMMKLLPISFTFILVAYFRKTIKNVEPLEANKDINNNPEH